MWFIFSQCYVMGGPADAILRLENMLPDRTAVPFGQKCAAALMDDGYQGSCGNPTPSNIQFSELNGLTSSPSESAEQNHLDLTGQEEATFPSLSFHDSHGSRTDWDEYDRLADLKLERVASDNLHPLYPYLYEEAVEKHDPAVDLSMYVAKGCSGEE